MAFDPTLATAIMEGKILTIGDRMRFSGELLRQIAEDHGNGSAHVVTITDIRQCDGYKEIVMERGNRL